MSCPYIRYMRTLLSSVIFVSFFDTLAIYPGATVHRKSLPHYLVHPIYLSLHACFMGLSVLHARLKEVRLFTGGGLAPSPHTSVVLGVTDLS